MRTVAGFIALAVILAGASDPARAQSARVTGRLLDASSERPVGGATLTLVPSGSSAVTDDAGRFSLAAGAGPHLLRISHVGYGTHEDSLDVGAGQHVLTIRISPRAIVLETLRVQAAAREPTSTSRTYVITRAQIEATLARARNVGDVVRAYMPGASVYETRAGYVCLELRGARGARTRGCNFPLVVVDGLPIQFPAQFLRDTPPEDLERIEFVPASAGAGRYGVDSQYGTLVVQTRRSGAAARAAQRIVPSTPRRFPSYQWEREPGSHPWERTMAASAAGNLVGVAAGLAVLGCFGGDGGDCLTGSGVGAGLAALALPAIGATLGARLFGETDLSHGRVVPAAVAAIIPLVLGYAMYRDGETADFSTSRMIGSALVFAGAPAAATIADGLFRRERLPENR